MAEKMGTLYVVGLPIGNVKDLTQRSKEVLEKIKVFACEDTREFKRLAKELSLPQEQELISFFEHTERAKTPYLIQRLKEGEDIGLVVSRGMPLISDPGYVLVREALRQNIPLHVIPGVNAGTTALAVSGLPCDKFLFLGFPPRKPGKQLHFFEKYSSLDVTLVFYESPRRLMKTLQNLKPLFGDWAIAICRELTKQHEEVIRGNYTHVLEGLAHKEILGEITVVLSPLF